MRATDLTRAPCNLRSVVEITRGDFHLPRSTALLLALTLIATGATAATWFIALVIFQP